MTTDAITPEQPRTAAGEKAARMLAQGINPQWEGLRDYDNSQYVYAKHLIAQVEDEAKEATNEVLEAGPGTDGGGTDRLHPARGTQTDPVVARPAVAAEGLRAALHEIEALAAVAPTYSRAGWSQSLVDILDTARAALASDAGSVGALDVERLRRAIRAYRDNRPLTRAVGGELYGPGRIIPSISEDMADELAAAYDAERQGESDA